MEISRKGEVTEYKKGHYYLSITKWEDGHIEIEVHRCYPVIIFHSCDKKDLNKAKKLLEMLGEEDPRLPPIQAGKAFE